jgi:hypothetical protein
MRKGVWKRREFWTDQSGGLFSGSARAFPLWRYSYRGGRGSDGLTAGLALSPGEFTNNSNVTSNLLNLDREEAMGYCQ